MRLGYWFNCEQTCGIEGSFFHLEGQNTPFSAGSANGSQIIGRPFFDPTGRPNAQLISFPGLLAGTGSVDTDSNLFGGDLILRKNLCRGCNDRLDLQIGYRFLRYDDSVGIREDLRPLSPVFVPGTQLSVQDSFAAQNQFHGAVFGLAYERHHGRWSVEAIARIDLGATLRELTIDGSTRVSVPGVAPVVNAGGLLAQTTNIGMHRTSSFAVVPELELNLGYQLTRNIRVIGGYNFMYWTQVARAGEADRPDHQSRRDPADNTADHRPRPPGFSQQHQRHVDPRPITRLGAALLTDAKARHSPAP